MTAEEAKALRLSMGLSRHELAAMTGKSAWSIKAFENRRPIPEAFEKHLRLLAKERGM